MTTPAVFDAIGWAVVHSLWQGLLIGGVVLMFLHAYRMRSASLRHATSFLGLLAMLFAFAATTTLMLVESTDTTSHVVASTTTSDTLATTDSAKGMTRVERGTAVSSAASAAANRALAWLPGLIAWIWLAGVGLMTIRLSGQWCWTRRIRSRDTQPVDAAWQSIFESLKARCGVDDRVRLLVSRAIDSPMAVGWLHPMILVPASAFTALDPEQLRTILVHELHHLARRDHLLNMVQAVIEVVLFFHPVAWWLSRQVRIEREFRCDDATLEVTDSPRSLAEALLALESLRTLNHTRPSLQLAATGGSLMHRITRLTSSNPKTTTRAGWRILSASTILAVAGASVAATSLESPAASQPQVQTMGTKLRKQVTADEMTAEDAKAKYEAAKAKMWRRPGMAEKKNAEGEPQESPNLATLKAAIEERLKALGVELHEQVAAGEMTAEDAKAKYDAAEEKMWRRYRMAEEKVGKGDRRDSPDRDELKIAIEERLQTMGMELRRQVAAGHMTAEDAKAKYDAAEEKMWRRYRLAEEKAVADD